MAFTLIEVLVALTIFALAGVALTAAGLNILGTQEVLRRHDPAAPDLALVRRAFCAVTERKQVEQWNETLLPGNRLARWRAQVTATPVADLFEVVLEIELPIAGARGPAQFIERMRLLRPTWSEPAEREARRAATRARLERKRV